jgi:monoamine oxidase
MASMMPTRRSLLSAMAKLGGAGAVYETLAAWDFLTPPPALAASFELPKNSGKGNTVAILGAGVSGLCAAYELDRAGYDCIVLEPTRRAGGRSLTLRRGDRFQEMGHGEQVCEFDDGLYLNAGPGRIPHHHTLVIDYCRRLGVALEPYIFASRANLIHSGPAVGGVTRPLRDPVYSLQGHVAELLDKCSNQSDLALPIGKDDLELLQDMLVQFGDLTATGKSGNRATYSYINEHARAGYERPPGVADPGKPVSPLRLDEILRSRVWDDWLFRDAVIYWQTSLMQPTGGMDMFFKGFLRQPLASRLGTLEGLIRYGTRTTGIEVRNDKVTVAYLDSGTPRTLDADYCISTVPMPIFRNLTTNLPAAFMAAARNLPPRAAGKVGWQAPRFWETDDNIYGGISWTNETIGQIWYPSDGYLKPTGILTGAYMSGPRAVEFNSMPVAERLQIARDQGSRLHPDYGKYVERGLAIGWNNMEFEQWGWADSDDDAFGPSVAVLAQPQGRFIVAGDQISFWSGWMEGAVQAALHAVVAIDRQARPTGTPPTGTPSRSRER